MIIYNYSSLQRRETKLYDIGGYKIAGGISVGFIKVVGPVVIASILAGVIISLPFGISFFNPFSENFIMGWTMFWIIFGISIGCALWFIQFSGYRLYQYLAAYFKPKKVYMNTFKKAEVRLTTIKINAFVKNIL